MHFSTVIAAVAAFGVSAVSAAPAGDMNSWVLSWDDFVAKGVKTITTPFPDAKVISIHGATFDGKPTNTIMNIQLITVRMEVGEDSYETTNFNPETKEILPKGAFSTPERTGRKPIGNTAFVFNQENVSVNGHSAQAALNKKFGDVTYTEITLRNAQFPFGQNYFFYNEVDSKQYVIKAQVEKPAQP